MLILAAVHRCTVLIGVETVCMLHVHANFDVSSPRGLPACSSVVVLRLVPSLLSGQGWLAEAHADRCMLREGNRLFSVTPSTIIDAFG